MAFCGIILKINIYASTLTYCGMQLTLAILRDIINQCVELTELTGGSEGGMDFLLELLLNVLAAPFAALMEKRVEDDYETMSRLKVLKWVRVLLLILLCIALIAMFFLFFFGIYLIAVGGSEEKDTGRIMLSVGILLLVLYAVAVIILLNVDKKRGKRRHMRRIDVPPAKRALRRIVHVVVDRPVGSVHPEHPDVVYTVNYGFVPTDMGGDGEPQDAYILGVDEPVAEFDGTVIAVIHRIDDEEDKWVVAPHGCEFSDAEILEKTEFMEKFFKIELIR